ncbi:MAG: hydantoinase/oxoprolinase family protein [Deltaproteobacteria bacterium]|jgi:N-methylhydantoinase A/oxoprolinase/acetone carboxylase beta subunit|nr:hydantoinase/oxoprolinase family protein [Deltaproteobacteria bacterium]
MPSFSWKDGRESGQGGDNRPFDRFEGNGARPATGLVLALDTGGTNTDAVLYDPSSGAVLAEAKDSTTHHDLAIGIVGALTALSKKVKFEDLRDRIRSVNLSTTLATNAIAEGYGHRVGLVMVGLDSGQELVRNLLAKLPAVTPIFVSGGHDYYGREETPLDGDELAREVKKAAPVVSAWAISSFFSVKNPAHELRAQEIIKSLSDKPVTLGRHLTGELGAMRRAATAALNAGLVIIVNRLLDAVADGLARLDISAPIMVVKGDGGLVGERWARTRPIETVVSGPAAGLVGAMRLARGFLEPNQKDLWVLDVGGTTSDLAYLQDGLPAVSQDGAMVGQWHTMVQAVDIFTRGLGGDSLVDVAPTGEILIGPRRVLPLCRLEELHPGSVTVSGIGTSPNREPNLTFLIPNLPPGPEMGEDETDILAILSQREGRPLKLSEYQTRCLALGRLFPGLRVLTHPAILASSVTPTDCMNVLGLFNCGSLEASYLGTGILAAKAGLGVEEFCRKVLDRAGEILASDILAMALNKEGLKYSLDDFAKNKVLGRMVSGEKGKLIELRSSLKDTVILLGAPAQVMAPYVAKHTGATVVAPPGCQVASAVGAAASTVSLIRKVDVVSLPDFSGFRAFLPDKMMDANKLERIVNLAAIHMEKHMKELAAMAGLSGQARVSMERQDRDARLNDGTRMIMGSTLTFRVNEAATGQESFEGAVSVA